MSPGEVPWDEVDPGIRPAVVILVKYGFRTFSSCQGGDAHIVPQPYVLFYGGPEDGMRAVWALETHGYRVWQLSRHWPTPSWPVNADYWERRPSEVQAYWEVQMRSLDPLPPLSPEWEQEAFEKLRQSLHKDSGGVE